MRDLITARQRRSREAGLDDELPAPASAPAPLPEALAGLAAEARALRVAAQQCGMR